MPRLPVLLLAALLSLPVHAGLLDTGFDAEYNVYMIGLHAGLSSPSSWP